MEKKVKGRLYAICQQYGTIELHTKKPRRKRMKTANGWKVYYACSEPPIISMHSGFNPELYFFFKRIVKLERVVYEVNVFGERMLKDPKKRLGNLPRPALETP